VPLVQAHDRHFKIVEADLGWNGLPFACRSVGPVSIGVFFITFARLASITR